MRIGEVGLLTNDVRKLSDFYKKLLNVDNNSDDEIHQTIISGGTTLTVYNDGTVKNNSNENICLAFTVEDIEFEYQKVKSLGCEIIEEPTVRPWGAINMSFYDPDKNIIYLRSFINNNNKKTSIIGVEEVECTISGDMDKEDIYKTNSSFWDTKGNEVIGTTALPKYGTFVSEEKYHLFGDVSGKKLLEIGCGTGHSLKYHGDHKASELWGLDISQNQIEKAREYLLSHGFWANLICSPMEEYCEIPVDYFDYVYSIYGIGWTTDLEGTFCRIASYIKKDGVFIFSWSHPIHKCVAIENEVLYFKKSYFDESRYSLSLEGGSISLSDRKLSTYINALAKVGFVIEEIIEESDDDIIELYKDSAYAKKAKILPITFVIKARKL